jgi:hypothetical protein
MLADTEHTIDYPLGINGFSCILCPQVFEREVLWPLDTMCLETFLKHINRKSLN